jgi:excinuclease UvrABC ATPase subunit
LVQKPDHLEEVAQGTFEEILKSTSLTAKYLNGELEIAVPKKTCIQEFHRYKALGKQPTEY